MNYLKRTGFTIAFWLLSVFVFHAGAQQFIHPGLLQSTEDIERMKKAVAKKQEPIYGGFVVFQAHPQSQFTYKMQGPMAMVGRNPTVGQGTYDGDAGAAYQNAVMWAITGKKEYADKAKEIINAWSATLTAITGYDAVLMAGLGPFKMVNAAEILRYTNAGWSPADIAKTEKHFKEVIYPVIKNYSPFANGNWDAAAMKTAMAIGIFCNDQAIFEKALRYYEDGAGDGRLTNYIINDDGQCQESGRDQAHTQLGIAHLADCSEMAWHQGLNLYAYANDRLLKGFEYTAKYNVGLDVPYEPVMDRTGKYLNKQLSPQTRGRFRTIYEQVYNHYVNRMGLTAPYTLQVIEKIRPEKEGSGGDNVGFGTLLYAAVPGSKEKINTGLKPVAPAGLIAKTSLKEGNAITWVKPIGAESYTIKRSDHNNGPYTILAKSVITETFRDTKASRNKTYYYTVSASNKNGESKNAYPVSITTGLPVNWKEININSAKGYAAYDGQQFTVEGGGMMTDSLDDQLNFACQPLNGDGTITVRYVPQISSQFTSFGLSMREALTGNTAQVSLIISPTATGQIETPGWYVKLFSRDVAGNKVNTIAGSALTLPIVDHGRLTGHCWLRLQRKGNEFTGYYSVDGESWIKTGSTVSPLKKQLYVGLPVSSGVTAITTTVVYDHISVNDKPVK
jgi:hypothetical protein